MALLSIKQASIRSGIPERTLRNWCVSGHIKALDVGIWLIDSTDLDKIDRPPHISQIRKEEKRRKLMAKTTIS